MTKDDTSEQNNDRYVTKVQEAPMGELFVELPQKLIDQLGWECGDEVKWEESEICEDWGEHKGITLSNKSKLFVPIVEEDKKNDVRQKHTDSLDRLHEEEGTSSVEDEEDESR